jgi:hypothetical protein
MPYEPAEFDPFTLLLDPSEITPLMVSEYALWFVNGQHFYLQNAYLMPNDGDFLPWAFVSAPLTHLHIQRHLAGLHTISLPTLNPESSCCKWFGLDGDYPGAEKHLADLVEEMVGDGLAPAYEHSNRGAHVWVLFSDPVPARLIRIYLYYLLDSRAYAIKGARGNKEGIEIFPKQESLEPGKIGNCLRGPLGIHRKAMRRFWFRDAEPNFKAQFSYLRRLPRCSLKMIEELTDGMDMPEDRKPAERRDYSGPLPEGQFDITKYVDSPRRRSRNDYFVQCPSCAEAGHDTHMDNLHVTEVSGRPPLFTCFAGCQFKDISEASYRRAGVYPGRRLE